MTETKRAIASRTNGAKGGKPRRGRERRITISIVVDTDVLSRLDTAAVGRSRSAVVEAALVAYLHTKEATMLDLEPIKARHAAATRGVWMFLPQLGGVFADIKDVQGILAAATPPPYDDRPDDMAFIAAAHYYVPALIAEIERLRAGGAV